MKLYIEEELAKGFIRPSTSPTSAGFFFVKKRDGGLRLCIDYRGLNDITISLPDSAATISQLHLVPAALEQLCRAMYYTKLDLRNEVCYCISDVIYFFIKSLLFNCEGIFRLGDICLFVNLATVLNKNLGLFWLL